MKGFFSEFWDQGESWDGVGAFGLLGEKVPLRAF